MKANVRNLVDDDLPMLVKQLNEDSGNTYEFKPFSEEKLRSWIQGGRIKILIAEENGQIIGSAAYDDGHWGEEIKWLTTRKVPEQKLVANTLAEEAEKFVKKGIVFTAVDAGSPKVDEWRTRGYRQEGGLYHMVAGLVTPRLPPMTPENVTLRSLRPEEEGKFVEVVNLGFGKERVKLGDIQRWKTDSPRFDEKWIHVAETAEKLISVVVSKPDMIFNEFFNARRGYLGPATTLPEYRGKSIASALTARAMNFLLEQGMDSVGLYTSEANAPSVTLLQRIEFRIGHHWVFMRKNLVR